MSEIRYYVVPSGLQPFAVWFADLEPVARAKVTRAIVRLEQGNFSNVKSVAKASWNTGSISGRAIAFILGVKEKHW
jgi:putative component of toxin-antitoxin plasmid stabilization module